MATGVERIFGLGRISVKGILAADNESDALGGLTTHWASFLATLSLAPLDAAKDVAALEIDERLTSVGQVVRVAKVER